MGVMIYYESSQAVTTPPEGWYLIQLDSLVTMPMLKWCDNHLSIGNYIFLDTNSVCFSLEQDAVMFALKWIP